MTELKPRDAAAPAPPPRGMEAAWEAWALPIQRAGDKTRTLLRAAFEAGIVAGQRLAR